METNEGVYNLMQGQSGKRKRNWQTIMAVALLVVAQYPLFLLYQSFVPYYFFNQNYIYGRFYLPTIDYFSSWLSYYSHPYLPLVMFLGILCIVVAGSLLFSRLRTKIYNVILLAVFLALIITAIMDLYLQLGPLSVWTCLASLAQKGKCSTEMYFEPESVLFMYFIVDSVVIFVSGLLFAILLVRIKKEMVSGDQDKTRFVTKSYAFATILIFILLPFIYIFFAGELIKSNVKKYEYSFTPMSQRKVDEYLNKQTNTGDSINALFGAIYNFLGGQTNSNIVNSQPRYILGNYLITDEIESKTYRYPGNDGHCIIPENIDVIECSSEGYEWLTGETGIIRWNINEFVK